MRALVIANPGAGQGQHRARLDEALEIFQQHGWEIALKLTTEPGDATRLAKAAVDEGCDVVFGAGGDGTLNEILQALAGTPTALGVLPVGTANIWARELGLPLEPVGAARAMLESKVRLMDVALAQYQQGQRYFFLLASTGYDALVTGSVDSDLKRQLGMIAYLITAVRLVANYVGTPVAVRLQRKRLRTRLLFGVISNTRIYGGLVRLSPNSRVDDGILDIDLFRGRGWWQTVRHYVTIVLGRHRTLPDVLTLHSRVILIRSRKPLAVQLDGEPVGTTPLRVTCMRQHLRVLVPPTVEDGLFQDA